MLITAQTLWNLNRLAAICGYKEIGRVVDKLVREKMLAMKGEEYNAHSRTLSR